MSQSNESKVVLITGASGNLGKVVVAHFLEKGYRVIATVQQEDSIAAFEPHPQLSISVVDLLQEVAAENFINNAIETYKTIDAALLLAGGFVAGDIAAANGQVIRQQVALNFETAYYIARPLFAHMTSNNVGRLVFISARPALQPAYGKDLVAYSISKSMLLQLAALLNESARGTNVTATVFVISTIDTPLNRKSMPYANYDNWVTPEKIADLLAFVAGEESHVLRETVLKLYNNA